MKSSLNQKNLLRESVGSSYLCFTELYPCDYIDEPSKFVEKAPKISSVDFTIWNKTKRDKFHVLDISDVFNRWNSGFHQDEINISLPRV